MPERYVHCVFCDGPVRLSEVEAHTVACESSHHEDPEGGCPWCDGTGKLLMCEDCLARWNKEASGAG